jgi:hypothetical protein
MGSIKTLGTCVGGSQMAVICKQDTYLCTGEGERWCEVTLWVTVSQSVLVSSILEGLATRYNLLSEICGLVSIGRPLWLEDASAICSAITKWFESRRTRNHTLLSHLRLPQPGGPGSSPRNRMAQLYPRALGSLYVVSHDSQGYGGGILTLPQPGGPGARIYILHGNVSLTRTVYIMFLCTSSELHKMSLSPEWFNFEPKNAVCNVNETRSVGQCSCCAIYRARKKGPLRWEPYYCYYYYY